MENRNIENGNKNREGGEENGSRGDDKEEFAEGRPIVLVSYEWVVAVFRERCVCTSPRLIACKGIEVKA